MPVLVQERTILFSERIRAGEGISSYFFMPIIIDSRGKSLCAEIAFGECQTNAAMNSSRMLMTRAVKVILDHLR